MGRQAVSTAFATVTALAVLVGAAKAQSSPAAEPVAGDKGPKTLLEAIVGSNSGEKSKDQLREDDRLDPDRPHFPEASTTVGLGRAVLESGYTFTKKGASFSSHSAPEALLRVGMLAEWFEFRIGQNFLHEQQTVAGTTTRASGAQDLYLGIKLALTEQKDLLPRIALIPQMTVPTGGSDVSAGRVLPGLNVDCSWDVIRDFFSIELLVANNLVRDDMRSSHFELATGLTGAFQLTKKLEAFIEWDAFYPAGGGNSIGPRHYAVGGLVYFMTPNLALDARAGVGLNDRSNDFLAGVGFAVRY